MSEIKKPCEVITALNVAAFPSQLDYLLEDCSSPLEDDANKREIKCGRCACSFVINEDYKIQGNLPDCSLIKAKVLEMPKRLLPTENTML